MCGQYWICVNLDKKEFVHPHKLGAGLKLYEQLANYPSTGTALIVLCAAMPEEMGGGDFDLEGDNEGYSAIAHRTVGRWVGDRIAFVGDYAEDTDLPDEFHASKIWDEIDAGDYTDVSEDVASVLEHELHGKYVGDGWRTFVTGGVENDAI